MIKPWPSVRSEVLGDYRVFQLRRDWKRSPRTGQEHDFYVLDCPDWVNVIALAPAGKIILVEQYRHGTDSIDLEIPGGVVDPGDASPLVTGVRELREETGYEGENARILSTVASNPAIINNRCHTVLIENCQLKHPTQWDHGEDLITRLVPVTDLPALVRSGTIRHSLVVAALYHFHLLRTGPFPREKG